MWCSVDAGLLDRRVRRDAFVLDQDEFPAIRPTARGLGHRIVCGRERLGVILVPIRRR